MPHRQIALFLLSPLFLLPLAVANQAALVPVQRGDLALARAHWVSRDTIAWKPGGAATYRLHYSPEGGLRLGPDGVTGGESIALEHDPAGLDAATLERFPHLAGYAALKLSAADLARVPEMLRGQLAVSAVNESGALVDATSLQTPGVLDDLFAYDGPLGVTWEAARPTLRVWAPTARSVRLLLFADSKPATMGEPIAMRRDDATGVWNATGATGWAGKFYLYEVEVFVRATGRVERNLVTDPYSVSLATNSARSQIVDLTSAKLEPRGWRSLPKPPLPGPEDISVYELHLRDFSIHDPTVPAAHRGTYLAFTDRRSAGMRHLAALARSGLTHVHLLPVFDISSVNEIRSEQKEPDISLLANLPPDSPAPQAAIAPIRDEDGFNWGYDPFHYTVPEGSYATDPDGTTRIVEFRRMVQGLNRAGLRVVMDVVYNHTFAAGQSPRSVLDRIVPGYYHRLNEDGNVESSTCCANTASEHAMMERLVVDSIVTWATRYKVDGFRFDLMGHHMLSNMRRVRAALDALTIEKDGVDGRRIYVYGEGWNFGEVANNARGANATQQNLAGTGIGTFNDRLRDAARGGRPFAGYREQGFVDGLFYTPNETEQGTPEEQKARLLHFADWIRLGMAGNLKDYRFVDAAGKTVTGAELDYYGQPAGYTNAPSENVVYVSAHDNETLYDAIALKAPAATPMADRVRMQNLGVSIVALSQGVAFFHAGVDMLRSKSLDRDSFNSGDWFNRLDFGYETNNWGVGLPPAWSNEANWPVMQPLLANRALRPAPADIRRAVEHFREMLEIRRSSRLFHLGTAAEVQSALSFHNTGPDQIPGVIVMELARAPERIVVVVNASNAPRTVSDASFAGARFALHPVQARSKDPVVRTSRYDSATGAFTVPAYTTAVFTARIARR